MVDRRQRRPERFSRKRSGRALAAIVAFDLLAGGLLAYALARPSTQAPAKAATAAALALPPARTTASTSNRAPPRPHRQRTLAPATVLPDPKGSRAPRLPAAAAAEVASTGRANAAQNASFEHFAATQPGTVGLALAPLGDGPTVTFGSFQVAHSWSTMKVPVLATEMRDLEASGGMLSAQDRVNATLALTESDNSAGEALFTDIEAVRGGLVGASLQVQKTLRLAGDQTTVINTAPNDQGFTTWGQSNWPASGEVAFYRSLADGCVLAPADTRYVLGLMSQVVSSQRWGAGSAGFPAGVPLEFKAGWGPEYPGYLVRQSVIVGSGSHGLVFNMLARPTDGQFSSATQMLTATAAWVKSEFGTGSPHPAYTCP